MPVEQVQHTVVSRDGTPISYWRSGTGRPLVLVHGTTADHNRWAPVLELLGADASVCAVDRRGRGGSGDTDDYRIEQEFDDIATVVDALAEEDGGPVDLFGHSYGALCSVEAALLTSNVRKLVLYEPPMLYAPPQGLVDQLDALLAEGRRDEVLATFFREVVGMPDDAIDAMREMPAWQGRMAAAHTLPREERAPEYWRFDPSRYAHVAVPTLLLKGTASPAFLIDSTDAMADALPDVRVVVLEGQGHVAIDTAPEVLADAVRRFLAQSSP
jgi:pimeloyl-ACP methyl ester carboxylesterase